MNTMIRATVLLTLLCTGQVHAEPGNAPDTKGHFVLVVGGSASQPMGEQLSCLSGDSCGLDREGFHHALVRIQPFTIPGFTSFKMCVGAGRELQARLNTDGYVLDFACVATGR